jgi:hypothetical protein
MKKTFLNIFGVVTTLLTLCFSLSACGGDDDDINNGNGVSMVENDLYGTWRIHYAVLADGSKVYVDASDQDEDPLVVTFNSDHTGTYAGAYMKWNFNISERYIMVAFMDQEELSSNYLLWLKGFQKVILTPDGCLEAEIWRPKNGVDENDYYNRTDIGATLKDEALVNETKEDGFVRYGFKKIK